MRKLHWLKWELLIESKLNGGLGFIRMQEFNESRLAKHDNQNMK